MGGPTMAVGNYRMWQVGWFSNYGNSGASHTHCLCRLLADIDLSIPSQASLVPVYVGEIEEASGYATQIKHMGLAVLGLPGSKATFYKHAMV